MTMRLISTRDRERRGFSYAEVLLQGLAPDGGLYVPASYPSFTTVELESLAAAPYAEIAFAVKRKLVGGAIPDETLKLLVADAYGAKNFDAAPIVTPASEIGEGLYLQNLSLGPTASFKDMAMQILAREMNYLLDREDKTLFILGATSGDTGSAAEAAVKGLSRIGLAMLSPRDGMSAFQKAQMGALSGGNVWNVSIRGRFDDCQDLVKAAKSDPQFAHLGAVNSINWGRVSAQVAYYFAGYLKVAKRIGDAADFAVPSGNFGNAFSGHVAKKMGLPVRRIIVATNENNVLDRLFKSGIYEARPASVTSSPSMDISKASNYERLAFDVFENDAAKTAAYMQVFAKTGKADLRDFGLTAEAFADRGFVSGSSGHAGRLAEIQRVYKDSQTIIDPHTADGVHVARQLKGDAPVICFATALPVKFEATIEEALGFVPERPARFKNLNQAGDEDFTVLDASADELKSFLKQRLAR